MTDCHQDDLIDDLKKQKRRVKRLRSAATVDDFASEPGCVISVRSLGSGSNTQEGGKRQSNASIQIERGARLCSEDREHRKQKQKKKKKNRKKNKRHDKSRKSSPDKRERGEPGGDETKDAGCGGEEENEEVEPMNAFIKQMHGVRSKSRNSTAESRQQSNECHTKRDKDSEKHMEGAPVEGLLQSMMNMNEMGAAGATLAGKESNLLDHLTNPTVKDRWITMSSASMSEEEAVELEAFENAWYNQGVPALPEEYRKKLGVVRAALTSGDVARAGGTSLEVIEGPVSRFYIDDYLRSPREQGERACAAGENCQANAMWKRSFMHACTDTKRANCNKTLREFLLPSEAKAYAETGVLREQPGCCVVCQRFMVSMLAKFRATKNADVTSALHTGLLCSHSVIVDQEGEYASGACLFAETPREGIHAMYVEHMDNRYKYEFTDSGVRLRETGVRYVHNSPTAGTALKSSHLN